MKKILFLFCIPIVAIGCDSKENMSLGQQSLPIINGKLVTGNDHLAVTMLAHDNGEKYGQEVTKSMGEYSPFCTSALITPNYVLTAAHCLCNNERYHVDLDAYRSHVYVFVAQSPDDIRGKYEIEAFYTHPGYGCSSSLAISTMKTDIALIKLKKPVPLSVAKPIAPMPPSLAITAEEVESDEGVNVVDVGFGSTYETIEDNHKREMISRVYAYCPSNAKQSALCNTKVKSFFEDSGYSGYYDYELSEGRLFTRMNYGSHSSVCYGDSGGPTLFSRNGIPYVVGVHSQMNSDCDDVDADVIVSDHYDDFIRGIVTDLPDDTPETNCSNGIDDNGDGRMDCEDPWCFYIPVCMSEICDDNIDNNDNGLMDCEDPNCISEIHCQPEICDDEIDNNGDGKVDCQDSQCDDNLKCHLENCTDCNNPACINALICQQEVCDDKIDNNGNGYVDCGDPQCVNDPVCQTAICDCSEINCTHALCIEICDDQIDNNGDGKIDCNDMRCAEVIQCQGETCNDKIDNNGDGFVDCDDPLCKTNINCQSEICDDQIDNNGDGKIDCQDPVCADRYICNPYTIPDVEFDRESGCSTSTMQNTSASHLWLYLLGLLGLLRLVRRRYI